jgi:hypothetical protein
VRAYTAVRAIEAHPADGGAQQLLEHAGAALGVPLSMTDAEPPAGPEDADPDRRPCRRVAHRASNAGSTSEWPSTSCCDPPRGESATRCLSAEPRQGAPDPVARGGADRAALGASGGFARCSCCERVSSAWPSTAGTSRRGSSLEGARRRARRCPGQPMRRGCTSRARPCRRRARGAAAGTARAPARRSCCCGRYRRTRASPLRATWPRRWASSSTRCDRSCPATLMRCGVGGAHVGSRRHPVLGGRGEGGGDNRARVGPRQRGRCCSTASVCGAPSSSGMRRTPAQEAMTTDPLPAGRPGRCAGRAPRSRRFTSTSTSADR